MRTQLIFVSLLLGFTSFSQSFRNFRSLGLVDGMTSNTVNAALQDAHGYIWLGTEDGLNKYDASTFVSYRAGDDSTSIASNTVTTIFEDTNKALWVGTNDGLARYDRGLDVFLPVYRRKAWAYVT